MNKTMLNMMVAVIVGGIVSEFIANRTPIGDFID